MNTFRTVFNIVITLVTRHQCKVWALMDSRRFQIVENSSSLAESLDQIKAAEFCDTEDWRNAVAQCLVDIYARNLKNRLQNYGVSCLD